MTAYKNFSDAVKSFFRKTSFAALSSFMIFAANSANAVSVKNLTAETDIALLTAISLDKTQTIKIKAGIISGDGLYGVAEIDGWAAGNMDSSINGMISLWLSAVQASNEPGTYEEEALPGWNIMVILRPGQSPEDTAKSIAERINSDIERPFYAIAHCHKVLIYNRKAYQGKNSAEIRQDCEKTAGKPQFSAKIKPFLRNKSANTTKKSAVKETAKTGMSKKHASGGKIRMCIMPMD